MAFEEITFETKGRAKLSIDECVLHLDEKKWYLKFNRDLSSELIKKGLTFCTLEFDKETDELRFKFRKYDSGMKLTLWGKNTNLLLTNHECIKFIKDKLAIKANHTIIHISGDKSNVLSVQLRYLTK